MENDPTPTGPGTAGRAPGHPAAPGPGAETAEERIARLEKELAQAKLERDLYGEIISVAEQRFGIRIRKKAGAKQ